MSLLNDIVSFGFLGYRGEIKTELQAPLVETTISRIATGFLSKDNNRCC